MYHQGLWWIMTPIEPNRDPPFWAPRADEHPRQGPGLVNTPGCFVSVSAGTFADAETIDL